MDGQGDMQVLLSNNTELRVEWPNGLTIDFATEKLYWVDSVLDVLGRSELNGDNAEVLQDITFENSNIYAYSLEFFGERLFWGEWLHEYVFSVVVGRLGAGPVETFRQFQSDPCAIRVVDQERQPLGDVESTRMLTMSCVYINTMEKCGNNYYMPML